MSPAGINRRFTFLTLVIASALSMVWFVHGLLPRTDALPDHITPLPSDSGAKLLEESAKEDYDEIDEHFISQSHPAYCGLATSTIVLNALGVRVDGGKFDEKVIVSGGASSILSAQMVRERGITLDELSNLLRAHAAQTEIFYGDELELDEFRDLVKRNSEKENDYVLINYSRNAIGQKGGGHISPIAAYHATSDQILIMDVRRDKYPPIWISTEYLWRATRTHDPVSGKSRGVVIASVPKRRGNL